MVWSECKQNSTDGDSQGSSANQQRLKQSAENQSSVKYKVLVYVLFFIFFVIILKQAVRSKLAKVERILTQNIVITSASVYTDATAAKFKFTQVHYNFTQVQSKRAEFDNFF